MHPKCKVLDLDKHLPLWCTRQDFHAQKDEKQNKNSNPLNEKELHSFYKQNIFSTLQMKKSPKFSNLEEAIVTKVRREIIAC